MTKPLRQTMPTVAALIDDLREVFGADMINAAIRAGIEGQPTFHASENGIEIGTACPPDPAKSVSLADIQLGNTCVRCAHSRLGKGGEGDRQCTRHKRPARAACGQWKEAA